MNTSAPGVVLALLALASPLGAQARGSLHGQVPPPAQPSGYEPWHRLGAGGLPREDAAQPAVVEGRVFLPDGRPAAGAVVVSSAGGSAAVGEDGCYVLDLRLAPGVSALQVTAVANGATGPLRAQSILEGLVPRGTTLSEPLHLTSSPGCTLDWVPTFGSEPGVNDHVFALTVFDDGSGAALYAGGQFTSAGGQAAGRVARWDGNAWSALGGGVFGKVCALTVFDDGTGPALYAGGAFIEAEGQPASRIAKWDGSAWSALGGGVSGGSAPSVDALAVFDDGSGAALYAGGRFTSAGGQPASRLAKWDGSAWSPLGRGLDEPVLALAVYDDGAGEALYAGGDFTQAGGQAASRIARWDGSAWSALGSGVAGGSSPSVHALAVFDDGSGRALYAAGTFTAAGGGGAGRIAKWDGSAWSALGNGLGPGDSSALAVFDDGSGAALYVGGRFTSAGGQPASRIAKWDGSAWSPLGSGMNTDVLALTVFDDGSGTALYAGGKFWLAGGQAASRIAGWDGGAWSLLGSGGVNGEALALTVFDGPSGPALHAGGHFTGAGGHVVNSIARWDGSTWSPLGSGLANTSVRALGVLDDGSGAALYVGGEPWGSHPYGTVWKWDGNVWAGTDMALEGMYSAFVFALVGFDDGSGAALYVGGAFLWAQGQLVRNITKWIPNSTAPVGGGMTSVVRALTVFDDASGAGPALYAGGNFTSAGGQAANRVAKWDGSTWSPLGSGLDGPVRALAVFDDGSGPALYAGGDFTAAGGQPASHVAKWDGSGWSPLGIGTNGNVFALAAFDGGPGSAPALYVGGDFTAAGGQAANHIAKWDGSAWAPLGSGVDKGVRALVVFDDGAGEALAVGGAFTISPAGDSYIARWGCGGPSAPGRTYCPGDGSGTACPCGNAGGAGEGCANGTGQGAVLSAAGSASVVAADLVLSSANLPPGQPGLFFQGNAQLNGGAGLVFGDGLRCAGLAVVRLEVVTSDAGGSSSTTLDIAAAGGVSPGDTRRYQHWYRDALASPCGTGFNLTNGLELVWAP